MVESLRWRGVIARQRNRQAGRSLFSILQTIV